MLSVSTNQRRRSTRNRRNRQPTTPTNQRPRIEYEPKTKYSLSHYTEDGVLVVSARKRPPPTAEQKAVKRAKQMETKVKQMSLLSFVSIKVLKILNISENIYYI